MAVSWLQCVSLQSRPVFEQDESLALPINVRASQVLDPYGVFPHRHVVAHGVVFQPPGKGDTHLYLILHPVGKGFPRLIARHGFLPRTDMAVNGGFDESVDFFTT